MPITGAKVKATTVCKRMREECNDRETRSVIDDSQQTTLKRSFN